MNRINRTFRETAEGPALYCRSGVLHIPLWRTDYIRIGSVKKTMRKAEMRDVEQVAAIFERIHDEEAAGRATTGWLRTVYPVRQTAVDAVARGDLFVEEEDSVIVAAGIINQIQVPEYALCQWRYDVPDETVMVLHTLVVDPAAGGRGHGKKFVRGYEAYAVGHGCPYLRMDTNEKNVRARALYAKLGYQESSIVPCAFNGIPGVRLVCLEKKLNV